MVDRTREVVLAVYPGFQALDLAGPLEVLHTATLSSRPDLGYRLVIAGPRRDPITSTSGLTITPDVALEDVADPGRPAPHTLVVVGGLGARQAADDPTLVATIAAVAARAERVTSVCTGAFVLAAAGLLDHRRATTHWAWCDALATAFPSISIEPDAIYVRDDHVWTSAGVTAGMDLALALVTADLGAELAHQVAGWLVMYVRRGGGQSQFSAQMAAGTPSDDGVRAALDWIPDHLDADLSVAALAARASMGERTFARAFRAQTGRTPAAHVESIRIEAARRLLETTDLTVAAVAHRVGFSGDAVLHRAFRRAVATTPDRYRRHFATLPTTGGPS